MNKLGLHICYLRGTEYEHDMEKAIALVKGCGCDILEVTTVTLVELSKEARKAIRRRAEEHGLILTANGGLDPSTDISSDDPAIRRAGIEYLKRVLEAVNDIGAGIFCGINYIAWPSYPKALLTRELKQQAMDRSIQSMRAVIKTAEDFGVIYCFEVVNRFEQYLLNTAREGVLFAEEVGSPNARLLLDTFHMNIEEDDMLEAIRFAAAADKLAHLHVGESNRRIPGLNHSNINWPGVFATLKEIGYSGHMIMEPFVRMGLPTSMNTRVWRDLTENQTLEDYLRDVSDGLKFLRDGLTDKK